MGQIEPIPASLGEFGANLDKFGTLIENGALVDAKDENGNTPLHECVPNHDAAGAQLGHVEVLKCLIENGPLIDAKNNYGDTPLHDAAQHNQLKVLKCLIENGANVSEKNDYGYTPLDIATERGHQDVVNYLTEIMMEKKKAENGAYASSWHWWRRWSWQRHGQQPIWQREGEWRQRQ